MPHESLLIGLAHLGVVIAGFASIVHVFRPPPFLHGDRKDVGRDTEEVDLSEQNPLKRIPFFTQLAGARLIVSTALALVWFSLLPVAIGHVFGSTPWAFRISSALLVWYFFREAIDNWLIIREAERRNVKPSKLFWIECVSGSFLFSCLAIYNLPTASPELYLALLIWLLTVSVRQFWIILGLHGLAHIPEVRS